MAENTMQNKTESKVDIDIRASVWHKRFVKTSWETPFVEDFRSFVLEGGEGRSTARRGYETRVTKLVTEFQIGCFATILPAYRGIPFWPKREDRLRIESRLRARSVTDCLQFRRTDKEFHHPYIYMVREIDRVHAFIGRILLYYLKSNIYKIWIFIILYKILYCIIL